MNSRPTRLWPWLAFAFALLLLDQATKAWIVGHFALGEGVPVCDYFNVVRAHNTGAAFSFLAGAGGWQRWFFSVLGLGAAAWMVWMLKAHTSQRLFATGLALLLAGALGNVVDRLRYGYVVDFLDLHYGAWHFPAFNVADSAITLGAALLILDEVLKMRRAARATDQPTDASAQASSDKPAA